MGTPLKEGKVRLEVGKYNLNSDIFGIDILKFLEIKQLSRTKNENDLTTRFSYVTA